MIPHVLTRKAPEIGSEQLLESNVFSFPGVALEPHPLASGAAKSGMHQARGRRNYIDSLGVVTSQCP